MSEIKTKRAYPLSWPDGWKRTAAHNRVDGRFNKKEVKHVPSSTPGGQGYRHTLTSSITISEAVSRLIGELERMGVNYGNIVVSTNIEPRLDGMPRGVARNPDDPGAAVYWEVKGQVKCMAVDRYKRVADNIAALAATLDAMRAIERHGGAEILNRAFLGFAALPEKASQSWRAILGFDEHQSVTALEVNSSFSRLAKINHPDVAGGSHEKFVALGQARDNALTDLKLQAGQ